MADQAASGGLLQMLNQLFLHISALDLEKRKQSYRNTTSPVNIGTRLNRAIERIAGDAGAGVSGHGRASPGVNGAVVSTRSSITVSSGTGVSDVVDYFKTCACSDTSPYLWDKLMRSTWYHLHSALMHAHAGDLANARLHTAIAGQAMQEAAHFMSNEAYEAFTREVEAALARFDHSGQPDARD